MVGRQRFTSELTDLPHLHDGGVVHNGRVFDMRGMLPHSEARMRMCVMQVGKRGRWTYRDWARWRFLWKFFPWYARAVSRTQHMMWAAEWEEHDKQAPEKRSLRGSG